MEEEKEIDNPNQMTIFDIIKEENGK